MLAAIFRKEGKNYDELGLTLKYPLTTIRDCSLIHIEGISRKSDIKQTGKSNNYLRSLVARIYSDNNENFLLTSIKIEVPSYKNS